MTDSAPQDFTDQFWHLLEKNMGCVVPIYLKYFLRTRGYGTAASIGTLNTEDIQKLQEFFKAKLKKDEGQNSNRKNFFHAFHNDCNSLEILPGHVKLLEKIVSYVNSMTELHGLGCFDPRFEKNNRKFDRKTDSKVATARLTVHENNIRGLKTISAIFSASSQRSDNEMKKLTTPSNTASYFGDPLVPLAYDAKADDLLLREGCFANSVVEEQNRISQKITLWMKKHQEKHVQEAYDQFTEKINPKMVEVNVTVCCPICEEKIELYRTSSINCQLSRQRSSKSEIYSLTEFKRHVENHTNDSLKNCMSSINGVPTRHSDKLNRLGSRVLRENLDEKEQEKEADEDRTSSGTFLLNAFVAQAEKNVSRSKPGYRFDPLIKMFACFVKMIGGLLAYETLHANLPLSLPSTSTVDKFMKDNGPVIIEGKLRTEELMKYLKDRNLPPRVDLSEDATRITAKVEFDSKTNQLVGFALPMDINGMPISLSFDATTAQAIQDHFSNPKNYVSSSVVVVMAQPQSDTVPPFCLQLFLTDNTFTAKKILSRWNFTTHDLKQKGLKVDNYSTDGDPRSLKVMKFQSQLGVTNLEFLNCEWYSGGDSCNITYTQDSTHIGGKARNRILKVSRITPIGSKLVSITHLNYLIDHISKDKHLLTPHDVQPKDRQNFHSVEKICAPIVLSCLEKYVPDSEGTAMFLKTLNFAIYSYLDKKMTPADRVYKIWYAIFFFRVWRSWLIKSKYTLKESFISSNCYTCIELNGHTLVEQLLKTYSDANYVFNPKQQGSQQCESMFRQVRSMSSTYSTVVNCSMLDIVNRIRKIQLQSDIMAACFGIIKFPRLEKKEQIAAAFNSVDARTPLSKDVIISWIEKAKADLTKDMMLFGINAIKLKLDFKCQVKPTDFDQEFEYDDDEDEMRDKEWYDDEIQEDDNDACNDDCVNDMDPAEAMEFQKDLHKLSGITGELSLPNYSHVGVKVDPKGPYAVVLNSKGEPDVVLKSAICWMLSKNKIKSSSDRLQRVMEKDYQPHCAKSNMTQGIVKNDLIHVGEWCIFKYNNSILIGLILSFRYTGGTTLKARSFTKSFASINSDKEIGALGTWYSWNKDGVLKAKPMERKKHDFLPIECYKGTIEKPTYSDNILCISKNVLENMNVI